MAQHGSPATVLICRPTPRRGGHVGAVAVEQTRDQRIRQVHPRPSARQRARPRAARRPRSRQRRGPSPNPPHGPRRTTSPREHPSAPDSAATRPRAHPRPPRPARSPWHRPRPPRQAPAGPTSARSSATFTNADTPTSRSGVRASPCALRNATAAFSKKRAHTARAHHLGVRHRRIERRGRHRIRRERRSRERRARQREQSRRRQRHQQRGRVCAPLTGARRALPRPVATHHAAPRRQAPSRTRSPDTPRSSRSRWPRAPPRPPRGRPPPCPTVLVHVLQQIERHERQREHDEPPKQRPLGKGAIGRRIQHGSPRCSQDAGASSRRWRKKPAKKSARKPPRSLTMLRIGENRRSAPLHARSAWNAKPERRTASQRRDVSPTVKPAEQGKAPRTNHPRRSRYRHPGIDDETCLYAARLPMPTSLSVPAPCDASSANAHRAVSLQSFMESSRGVNTTSGSIPRRAERVNPIAEQRTWRASLPNGNRHLPCNPPTESRTSRRCAAQSIREAASGLRRVAAHRTKARRGARRLWRNVGARWPGASRAGASTRALPLNLRARPCCRPPIPRTSTLS